jgi:hypothetical protein
MENQENLERNENTSSEFKRKCKEFKRWYNKMGGDTSNKHAMYKAYVKLAV